MFRFQVDRKLLANLVETRFGTVKEFCDNANITRQSYYTLIGSNNGTPTVNTILAVSNTLGLNKTTMFKVFFTDKD